MFVVYSDSHRIQLLLQSPRRDGVAQKEVARLLVIDKIGRGVRLRQLPPCRDRRGVIGRVLAHLHAPAAKQILFPLLRVRRHVHAGFKSKRRADHTDAEA